MSTELRIDFGNPKEKMLFLAKVRDFNDKKRITIVADRPRRSDRQNRWYWPAFVQPFGEWLRAQGEGLTDDDAHEILKVQFNSKSFTNTDTGEVTNIPVSTTKLTTVEFNEYLDKCAAFLANYAGIVVPEPSIYHEDEPAVTSRAGSEAVVPEWVE